ncbi:LacI family transcriptional regulator [Microbacterium sp. 8M]|uniref:LacI family DNA-binding transcriptional regulator n=1 Tax=Microbacterium sp. 8M TaxID=2653153 RepID=UPI0012F449FA|nr:LacI family DNA-binding transcriptional regulator [Microbacterium sp. 8M]VXB37555.1 LacI family transcriptional regulator [Microbacterium sp. 8M]
MTKPEALKRVTAADVARALGISRATVGFVLNNTPGQTISHATRERVLAEAKRLGYRPHAAARTLRSGQSRIVLLILPDWPMDYSMRTHLDEASLVLDRAGYSLVTMTPHPGGQAQPLWETLRPDVVLGMAALPRKTIAAIHDSGVPHVIAEVLEDQQGPSDDGLRYAEGPRLQVEHLLAQGRTRLAFAGSSDPRIAELVRTRRALAVRTLLERTGQGFAADADLDPTTAGNVVEAWLADGIDGIVAYNDDIAALAVGAVLRAGRTVPGNLAVVGHDDSPLASLFVPSLTSVRVDTAGLGRYVAELALSAATDAPRPEAGPETEARLIVRESTAAR